MPPEPLPWERKDFVKERKHDRVETTVGSVARWRDSSHHGSREFVRSSAVDDIRRPLGYGRQGGYQLYSEEPVYGSTPFRVSERMLGDESFIRPSAGRGDGKYGRSGNRESRGSFSQKDCRGSSWEPMTTVVAANGDASASSVSRPNDISAKRSVSDLLTYSSHPHSDIENSSWDHQHDKMGSVNGLGTGPRSEKDQSRSIIGWKPLKWNRSSSLSSRGSGFSHTSSSRSLGADSDEQKPDSQSGRVTPIQSPSGEAAGAMTSSAPFEENCSRKKQRLGWGQGLAKYEKAKVEGSDETVSKSGLFPCSTNTKAAQIAIPSLPDKSPRLPGLSECASPVTTSSVGCSSSQGLEDKHHSKTANTDTDICNVSDSPGHGVRSCLEEFSINPEHVELTSITNLNSLLNDLLQPEDACSGDSNFVKSTAMNKLLILKCEFSKVLEKTESEIDLFENELKLLSSKPETNGPCSVASDSLPVESVPRYQEEVRGASKAFQKPVPLQLASSSDLLVDAPGVCNGALDGNQDEVKNDDIDSPGTATSKFIEPLSIEKAISASDSGKPDSSVPETLPSSDDQQCLLLHVDEGRAESVSGCRDGNYHRDSSNSTDLSQPKNVECNLNDILASNRELARKSFEELSKLFPTDQPQIDIWRSCIISCQQKNPHLKEKLAARKRFQRFKEKVLTLKFRSLQHLWKEDMRLLSIRKHKAKSQKRIDFLSRSNIGHQKHRSNIRSRFTSPAGSLTLVPTKEIVDFTSKLLSDSETILHRNSLRMPTLIIDEKERKFSRFITSNGLVEDPCAVEKERLTINPWTLEEKETFLEMLAKFGKDFKKISSFLDHKTAADCVEFYYKNHKSESFQKIKKKSDQTKQERTLANATYLITSGKRWNREVNAAPPDLLRTSEIAACADDSLSSRHTTASSSYLGDQVHYVNDRCWIMDASYEKSSVIYGFGNDREAAAADTLAGISGAISSEGMSSCVTSSIDLGEGSQEWKYQRKSDRPWTPKGMQIIDDEDACSDENCEELDPLDWTDEEKSKFIGALESYGKDFAKISRCVRTRSRDQCKIFFSKAHKFLGLELMHPQSGNEGAVSDANGEQSDTDDACVLELESAICSTQSCSKIDSDLPLSSMDTNCETFEHTRADHLQTEPDSSEGNDAVEHCNADVVETAMGESVLDDCCDGGNLDPVSCEKDVSAKGVGSDDNCRTAAGLISEIPLLPPENANLTAKTNATGQESPCSRGKAAPSRSSSDNVIEHKAVPSGSMADDAALHKMVSFPSTEGTVAESKDKPMSLIKKRCEGSQNLKNGVEASSSGSNSGCFISDSVKTSPNQASESSVNPRLSLTPTEIPLDLLPSVQKAQTVSWKQKENRHASADSALQDSPVLNYEEHCQHASSSSALKFEETGVKQQPKFLSKEMYQQYLSRLHSFGSVDSSQILRGYPLQVLNKKDANGHMETVSSENHSMLQNFSKLNGSFKSSQLLEHFSHEKRNGLQPSPSVSELQLLSHNHEKSSCYRSRSHSQGSSDTEEHSRGSGELKLFGQILSNPSAVQKPISVSHEADKRVQKPISASHEADRRGQKPISASHEADKGGMCLTKANSHSHSQLFTKYASDHGVDMGVMASKLDCSKYASSQDFPMRSYGFWDGNRIQTGFSSLPDSAILLAKYPAAFSTAASSHVDQQSLPAVVKRNDRNLGSVSVYPAKDVTVSGSLPDYQVYRRYDHEKVRPFAVDVNRNDGFCELPKRNVFDVSSFQQQATGVMGMNVMGAGILLGGPCTGVSDPVAAIKRHYATTERFVGQAGSIREEDSWRGDIGR